MFKINQYTINDIFKGDEVILAFGHELILTTLLKKDLFYRHSSEKIGNWINEALKYDEILAAWHKKPGYKHYVFNNLYPYENDGTYKQNRIYVIRLRSYDDKFLEQLKKLLYQPKNRYFQLLAVEKRKLPQSHITELYTVTPFVVTVDSKPWLASNGDFSLLEERLHMNTEKKYKDLFFEDATFERSFIQRIELLNSQPIAVSYKGIKLLGNKARISINEDEQSQKLAQTALVSGLAEKNSSIGAGFCFANYL